ncbi:SIMPL domain-containing protein [Smaragdicoccus niigatensis]|uniref:SIMPL domain-containing protein n=1 Tax=Smaragdicoccus niigatensis TaxID=359359 RepID=UPI000374DF46|nr:SIMPL domain-containing protein [Smaragdicoccus niigatensis]
MTRRPVTVLAAIAAAATLAGCGGGPGPGPNGEGRTVTVVGTGEVRSAPDALTAELGVSTSAADVTTAMNQANERAKAIIDSVSGLGVAKADIRTSQFTISPNYRPDGAPNGYQVTNMVSVVVRDLNKASKVIDAAVRAGGNDARVNSVSFTLDDDSKAVTEARSLAFADAKKRAQQYADLSDLYLGDVVTITEATSGSQPPVVMNMDKAAESVPLEPGTQSVQFQVTVKFSLR